MTKGQRITIFICTLLILGIVYWAYRVPISTMGDKAIIVFSSLATLSFVSLLAEHYFSRPTDVVASTLSALLMLSPIHPLLAKTGEWYWALLIYNATFLTFSLLSLLLLNKHQSDLSIANRISKVLYSASVTFANGKLVWCSVFIITTLFYVDNQSPLFVILLAYSAFLLAVNPTKILKVFTLPPTMPEQAVGEIFSVQSGNIFLAQTFPNAPSIERFDVVGFSSKAVKGGSWIIGLVLETYQLNQQRWLRVLTSDTFSELEEKTNQPASAQDAFVYRLSPNNDIQLLQTLVGTICEKSEIQKIKFEYAFQVPIEEGELVEVEIRNKRVLYQVVEGITETEKLESRDEAGMIVGEAVQLGVWNSATRRFNRFGWVPIMNFPVVKASPV
ncbi:MAG TPA: hypothetical protein V6C65_37725, partial [Allocoleopsis sp.]